MKLKTNRHGGADFNIAFVGDEFVLIRDLDMGSKSITNDAEAVVEMLLDAYGSDRRIFYVDSMLFTDEILHDGVRFTGFQAGIPGEFRLECDTHGLIPNDAPYAEYLPDFPRPR